MKLHDSIDIAAEAQIIWPYIADPVLMSAWNPKIVSVGRDGERPVEVGERFEMIYRLSRRDRETEVEVLECTPPQRVVYRHHMQLEERRGYADEIYDLSPRPAGTHLKQTIDMRRAGMPLIIRPLVWFVMRFGRPTGERYLEKLKRIVEESTIAKLS